MDDIQIVSELKKHVRAVFPEAEIYFYGSRVTKTHREDSDYDVLVILPEVNPTVRDRIYDIAWETGFKHDAFITPVLAEKDEFERMTASPFFNNVKHNGLVI
jgi:predicted nucleotidyltransferase